MFNRVSQWLRTAVALGITSAALIACGGGENLTLVPPCGTTEGGNVPVCSTPAFQYGTGASAGAVASNSTDYTLTGTRTGTTEAWGAVVAQLKLYAAQDVSSYKSLKLSLASSSNTEVTLMLVSSAAKECYPTYKVTGVTSTPKSFTIALTDFKMVNNPDAAKCGPAATPVTTDPDTPLALKTVNEIQVREIKGTAGKNAVNVVIGKPLLWSTELPPSTVVDTPAPPLACSSTAGGNVPICTTGAFQYDTGAADAAVANNASDYTLTGTRTAAAKPWGTVVAQLRLYAAQDVSSYKSLKLSLASSSNTEVMLMLGSSGAAKVAACYPSYKVTGVTPAAQTFIIQLTDFAMANNPDPKCTTTPYTDPDTAVALKSVTEIQVREIKGTAGKDAVNVVIGKPLLWTMELPKVVEPPTPKITAVTVGDAYAVGFGGEGDTTGASKSFTDSVSAPWLLTGTRIAGADAYSTIQGVLVLNSAQAPGDKAKTSIGFTLASSGNTQILVRLKSSAYTDGCTPSYLATGLTATAQAFTVALSEFKAASDLSSTGAPNYASCKDTAGTALDLANFDKIEITDRKETTGGTTINVTLSALNWVVAP